MISFSYIYFLIIIIKNLHDFYTVLGIAIIFFNLCEKFLLVLNIKTNLIIPNVHFNIKTEIYTLTFITNI